MMSQSHWDLLEEVKQDIIEGKVLFEFWDFRSFEGMDNTLTEAEKIEVFKRFPGYSSVFCEIVFETLEHLVEDVVSEREETIV